MGNFALHFNDIKKIIVNNEVIKINFMELKRNSREFLLNRSKSPNFFPVIHNLYRDKTEDPIKSQREIVFYQIKTEHIEPLYFQETKDLFEFVNKTFLAEEGYIALAPKGWVLTNDLKDSPTIRSFSVYVTKIVLAVDANDHSVITLELIK